ncbi:MULTISPECIES: ClpX C4-type zinc finger protein [unclassified Streptomyces]|uniref:ClpX C4-type zinc finger protein n=1 Tax=unclassified Streptomyces TaxID=2593676 RepID=UPI003D8D20A8
MSEQEQRDCNRGRAQCLGVEPQCVICGKGWERMTRLIVMRGGALICDECFEIATEELQAGEQAVSRERD